MKFFDIKCGIGTFSQPTEYTEPEQLLKIMDKFLIEKAVVYHSLSREINPVEGNKILIEKIKNYERLIPSWVLLPKNSGDIENFEKYVKEGVEKGVKFFWIFYNVYKIPLSHYVYSGTFEIIEKLKIPVLIEPTVSFAWQSDAGDWDAIKLICEKYPQLPVIFSEFRTRYHIRIVLHYLKNYENFYYDIGSCWNYKVIEKLVEIKNGENLVMGTNLPFSEPGQSPGMILASSIPENIKNNIGYKTIKKLLHSRG